MDELQFVEILKTQQSFGVQGLFFRYAELAGWGFIAAQDQMGFILERNDFEALVSLVRNWYGMMSDEDIADANTRRERGYSPVIQKNSTVNGGTRQQQPGYIYLLAGGDYCKIGKTVNVDRRMKQIRPILPFETELIHTFPTNDCAWAENELHQKFATKRTNGEWFKLSASDIAQIQAIKRMDH